MRPKLVGWLIFCGLMIVVSIVGVQLTTGIAQTASVISLIASIFGCLFFADRMRQR